MNRYDRYAGRRPEPYGVPPGWRRYGGEYRRAGVGRRPAARDWDAAPPRYDQPYARGLRRPYYDAPFRPLRPDEPLARALEHEAAELVLDYLREERYGEEYARTMGLRIPGAGDHLRDVARRIARPGYDRRRW